MLTNDQLQTLTLKASYVHAHADTPYFITEVNNMARRLREPAFLNFFVRYRSDKEDETRHRWSRINAVIYLSERESRLVKRSAGTAPAAGSNAATQQSLDSADCVNTSDNNSTAMLSKTHDLRASGSAVELRHRAARAGFQLTIDTNSPPQDTSGHRNTSTAQVSNSQHCLVPSLSERAVSESIVWRNKRFWVGLVVEGEEEVVYLPRLSAKPPTAEEVMQFCVHQANHHPEQVYTSESANAGSSSAMRDDSENGAMLDATSDPRQYLPTVQQMDKMKSYRAQRITQHQWTPEEIREMRMWKQRASELDNARAGDNAAVVVTAAAATPVESTLNRIQNMKLETELRRSLQGESQQNQSIRHSSQDGVGLHSTRNSSSSMVGESSEMALPSCMTRTDGGEGDDDCTATARTAAAVARSPLVRPSTPVSPFLPRRLLRRLSGVASVSSSAFASVSFPPVNNNSNSSTMNSRSIHSHSNHVYDDDADNSNSANTNINSNNNGNSSLVHGGSLHHPRGAASAAAAATAVSRLATGSSDASLSLSLSLDNHLPEQLFIDNCNNTNNNNNSSSSSNNNNDGAPVIGSDTVRRWERAVEQETAFYAYVSASERSAYLNKITEISRRNSVENRRNRLRGIANERRLERKGNLLESGGLWVTNDKERARKAMEYKESQDDQGKGNGAESTKAANTNASAAVVGNAVTAPVAATPTAEDVFLENFRQNYAQQKVSFDGVEFQQEGEGWWLSAPPANDGAAECGNNSAMTELSQQRQQRRRQRSEERGPATAPGTTTTKATRAHATAVSDEDETDRSEWARNTSDCNGTDTAATESLSAQAQAAATAAAAAAVVVPALRGSTRYRLVREGARSTTSSRIVTAQLLHSSATSMARCAPVRCAQRGEESSSASSSPRS